MHSTSKNGGSTIWSFLEPERDSTPYSEERLHQLKLFSLYLIRLSVNLIPEFGVFEGENCR